MAVLDDGLRQFQQFKYATQLRSSDTWYFDRVDDWDAKRTGLAVQLSGIPELIEAFLQRKVVPYEGSESMSVVDMMPSVRLATACESLTNGLYGLAEIAAQFANKASGTIPSSFNSLRKKIRDDRVDDAALVEAVGDLQWYEKVRELRTEWAHYSTVFVGLEGQQPLLVVKGYRAPVDREHFGSRSEFLVADIFNWTCEAMKTIDRFSGYLLQKHILPKMNREQLVTCPVRDKNGIPITNADNTFKVESITIGECLRRGGL